MTDEEYVAWYKAHTRGVLLGFTGIFQNAFVERELQMMQKWANQRNSVRTKPRECDYLPWGGNFLRWLIALRRSNRST
jgi:hypothetical protein